MDFFNNLKGGFEHMGASINNVFHPHNTAQSRPPIQQYRPIGPGGIHHGALIATRPVNTSLAGAEPTSYHSVDRLSGNSAIAKPSLTPNSNGLFPPGQAYIVPIVAGVIIVALLIK